MAGTTGLEPATSAVTVSVKLVTLSNQTARMAPFDALRHPWECLLCPYCARALLGRPLPKRSRGRRFLSPFLAIQQYLASHCTKPNNNHIMNDMDLLSTSHCVAPKCTKSRYKVAPKAAPGKSCKPFRIVRPADFRSAAPKYMPMLFHEHSKGIRGSQKAAPKAAPDFIRNCAQYPCGF